jgi:glyceraldehyde 3-phosphate dehydrogenase
LIGFKYFYFIIIVLYTLSKICKKMAKKIAINGFGRIGRLTFRELINDPAVEIVAINDLTDNNTLAHLLKYDSAHGPFNGTVTADDQYLYVNGKKIMASAERNPAALPWAELGVDTVLECTGIFRNREKAGMHLTAGAKKVLLSAPAKGGDIRTVVIGVNEEDIADTDDIISNASCTTNCMAPLVKVVMDNWGIKQGTMTTTHAYTGDQALQDSPHSDLRRARAAAFNIVPTSTGAANAVSLVIPEAEGKFMAMALRVPTITGSLVEMTVITDKPATVAEVNAKFKEASEGRLKGVLQYTEDPIVSSDIVRSPYSSIYDSKLTQVDGNLLKVVSWYDNEAGYSARLAQLVKMV